MLYSSHRTSAIGYSIKQSSLVHTVNLRNVGFVSSKHETQFDQIAHVRKPESECNITCICAGLPLVEVDEAGLRVRPANKRCTVILREIPQDTRLEVIYLVMIK